MALVKECNTCKTQQSASNPIKSTPEHIVLGNDFAQISIKIPSSFNPREQYAHICQNCLDEIVKSKFNELCGLIAPYKPDRKQGFIQGEIEEINVLSKEEQKALILLSKKLLKA